MTGADQEPGGTPTAAHRTLPELLSRPGTRVVLLGGSRDPNAKLTVVLLDDYGPAFVVKVPTTPHAARVVRREGDLLAALHGWGLGVLSATVPRPTGYLDADGLPALVSHALSGTPMTVRYHGWRHTARPRRVRRDFTAAGGWLAALQVRTAGEPAPVAMLDDALETIGTRFAEHPALLSLRRELAAPAERLRRQYTPRTVVHGDYWFGNLLVDGDRVVGVVDWEAGALAGEPLRDVARFALSYALYLDRHARPGHRVPGHPGLRAGSWGAGIAWAASGHGWFGDVVREYVQAALDRLGLPRSLWSDVLLAGIAEVAATADHGDFARQHLDLLVELTGAVAGDDGTEPDPAELTAAMPTTHRGVA